MVARAIAVRLGPTQHPLTCRAERRAFREQWRCCAFWRRPANPAWDLPTFDAGGAYSPDDASHTERIGWEGIIEQRPGTRRYVVGEQIPLLALSRRTRDPLLDIVRPHLRAAVGEIGDTGFLTRRTGLDTVCVARQLGTYPSRCSRGMSANADPLVSLMPELRSCQACRPTRCAVYLPKTDRAFLAMAYRRTRSCRRWR